MNPKGKLILWFVVVGLAIAGLNAFQTFYVNESSFSSEKIADLAKLQEKQLDLFLEMNHLLVTLATLALGGIGAFVFNRYKTGSVPAGQRGRAIASWIFAALSLLSGYVSDERVIWMLSNKFFDLSNPQIVWASRGQFWFFVLSLFCLGLFFYFGVHENVAAESGTPTPPQSQGAKP